MSFTLYAQYAAYTALLLIMIVAVSLALKSYFDEIRFQANYIWTKAMTPKIEAAHAETDFNRHVETTPGMKNAHLN